MPPATALWLLTVQLMDAITFLNKRPLNGKSLFHPGRDHFHHELQKKGFAIKHIVLSIYIMSLIIASIGLYNVKLAHQMV